MMLLYELIILIEDRRGNACCPVFKIETVLCVTLLKSDALNYSMFKTMTYNAYINHDDS